MKASRSMAWRWPAAAACGYLAIVDIIGANPTDWVRRDVNLTGLASYGGNDPEPEFVDVNEDNEAVVTLQENNHIAIVNLVTGTVTEHFPAGTATLNGIDKDRGWPHLPDRNFDQCTARAGRGRLAAQRPAWCVFYRHGERG